jgi:hypothetical protein
LRVKFDEGAQTGVAIAKWRSQPWAQPSWSQGIDALDGERQRQRENKDRVHPHDLVHQASRPTITTYKRISTCKLERTGERAFFSQRR